MCYNVDSLTTFLDPHDISKIPGVGLKIADRIRGYILGPQPALKDSLSYDHPKAVVTVGDVRLHPNIGPETLEKILHGLGGAKGLGNRIFELIHGVDNTVVAKARTIPTQISIEDSYRRLDTLEKVEYELHKLSRSLIARMYLDLGEPLEDDDGLLPKTSFVGAVTRPKVKDATILGHRWLAIPRNLRLSTRLNADYNPEGIQLRSSNRVSRSVPFPPFVLSQGNPQDLSLRLVKDVILPMFKKLHHEQFEISLINVAAVNIIATPYDGRHSKGQDISRMFKQQGTIPRELSIDNSNTSRNTDVIYIASSFRKDIGVPSGGGRTVDMTENQSNNLVNYNTDAGLWSDDDLQLRLGDTCKLCGATMPDFAKEAHLRFHQNLE